MHSVEDSSHLTLSSLFRRDTRSLLFQLLTLLSHIVHLHSTASIFHYFCEHLPKSLSNQLQTCRFLSYNKSTVSAL